MPDLSRTSSYDYELPDRLIASHPTDERRDARMLIVDGDDELEDSSVSRFADCVEPGDVVVFNDARVVRARLRARRQTGGKVEIFVIGTETEGVWSDGRQCVALLRANKSLKPGERLILEDNPAEIVITARMDGGVVELAVENTAHTVLELLQTCGEMPLPPYIVKSRNERDEEPLSELDVVRYQTVLASRPGAVAAPTAGLHFDDALIEELHAMGAVVHSLSLLVGIGTFRPVSDDTLDEHDMHCEHYEIGEDLVAAIATAREAGNKVIAIGTTVVRALEASAQKHDRVIPGEDSTDLFIRPGFEFRVIDALLTNFHLPKSTLLALVCAHGGYEPIMRAYEHAVAARYRFYSYGDCMFIRAHDSQ